MKKAGTWWDPEPWFTFPDLTIPAEEIEAAIRYREEHPEVFDPLFDPFEREHLAIATQASMGLPTEELEAQLAAKKAIRKLAFDARPLYEGEA